MTANEKRTQLQTEALATLMRDHRLILNWGTGVGKTRVAVKFLEAMYDKGARDFLLVIQERAHRDNWRAEFRKHLGDGKAEMLGCCVTIECYASLKKYPDTRWDAIVFDEAHHLRSDLRQGVLETLAADYVLCLTATMSEDGDGEELLQTLDCTFGRFTSLVFDIGDAIGTGILPEPRFVVVPVELSENAGESYDQLTERMESLKQAYYTARLEAGLALHGGEETDYTEQRRTSWMNAAMRRKKYIGRCKTYTAKRILSRLDSEGKRYVCFCADIRQAEMLGAATCINSKRTRKENDGIIEDFNSGRTNSIFAVGMIREGQNLADIDAGVIIQLDKKSRSFKQMTGRVMRGESPVVHVLYVPGTRDEEYLENAMDDVEQRYIEGYTKPVAEPEPEPYREPEIPFTGTLIGPSLSEAIWSRPYVWAVGADASGFVVDGPAGPVWRSIMIEGTYTGVWTVPGLGLCDLPVRCGEEWMIVRLPWQALSPVLCALSQNGAAPGMHLKVFFDGRVWKVFLDGRMLYMTGEQLSLQETNAMIQYLTWIRKSGERQ